MKVQYDKLMLMLWRMKIAQFYKVLDEDADDFTDKQKMGIGALLVAFQLADPFIYFEIPPESVKPYKVMLKVFKF